MYWADSAARKASLKTLVRKMLADDNSDITTKLGAELSATSKWIKGGLAGAREKSCLSQNGYGVNQIRARTQMVDPIPTLAKT